MANFAQNRRRQFGTACLILAAVMLVLGQTLLKPHLDGAVFLLYWLACFLFTALTIIIALLDARAIRQSAREQQLGLLEDALGKMNRIEKGKPAPRPSRHDDPPA